jgi:hypothetical protein
MLEHRLLPTEGLLIVSPKTPLESIDFRRLALEIDPYIEANGKLHGVMIDAESFPGWKNLGGLVAHVKFVKNHYQKVEKFALLTDNSLLTVAPRIAGQFVLAKVKRFSRSQREEALRWLTGAGQ